MVNGPLGTEVDQRIRSLFSKTSQCFHWHNWKQLPKIKAQRIILSVIYNDLSCLVSPGSTCDLNYLNQTAAFSLLLIINQIIIVEKELEKKIKKIHKTYF